MRRSPPHSAAINDSGNPRPPGLEGQQLEPIPQRLPGKLLPIGILIHAKHFAQEWLVECRYLGGKLNRSAVGLIVQVDHGQ
jgi:hypothetical protein